MTFMNANDRLGVRCLLLIAFLRAMEALKIFVTYPGQPSKVATTKRVSMALRTLS